MTEAYTWPVTAMIGGFAPGTAVGGSLVEALDWHACFVAAAGAAALGAAIAFAFRRHARGARSPLDFALQSRLRYGDFALQS